MDNRKHPRTNYRSPVHFISSHIPYRGCVIETTPDGIIILSDSRLESGSELKLCYSEERKISISKGIVVWSREERLGIKF